MARLPALSLVHRRGFSFTGNELSVHRPSLGGVPGSFTAVNSTRRGRPASTCGSCRAGRTPDTPLEVPPVPASLFTAVNRDPSRGALFTAVNGGSPQLRPLLHRGVRRRSAAYPRLRRQLGRLRLFTAVNGRCPQRHCACLTLPAWRSRDTMAAHPPNRSGSVYRGKRRPGVCRGSAVANACRATPRRQGGNRSPVPGPGAGSAAPPWLVPGAFACPSMRAAAVCRPTQPRRVRRDGSEAVAR